MRKHLINVIGIFNAYGAVGNFEHGNYAMFVVSMLITLWVASWKTE